MTAAAIHDVSARLCPSCGAWFCAATDAFCGGCGHPCSQLTLKTIPAVLPIGQVVPELGVFLSNPTCATLRVTGHTGPSWFEFPNLANISVAPESFHPFKARARTSTLREPQSAEISVETTIGETRSLLMALPENPALETSPPEIEYWPDGASGSRTYTLDCFPRSGHIRIKKLIGPRSPWLAVKTDLAEPVLVSRDHPLRLQLQFNPQGLPATSTQPGGEVLATVRVGFESWQDLGWTVVLLRFHVRKPPQLTWIEEHRPPRELRQTAGEILRLNLMNSDDSDPTGGRRNGRLEVRSVALRFPSAEDSVAIQLLSHESFSVAGGQTETLAFQLNLQSLSEGILSFELEVKTNVPALDRLYRVPVQVRAMQPFDGIVAIDFGTSNTCCALLSESGDLESIPLDAEQTTAPTLIRYLDLSGPDPVMETGKHLRRLAAEDEKVAASTLRRLKQKLGESSHTLLVRPRNSQDWVTREARDAAADYLRHIRTVAEKRKGNFFDDFILTHPAVCSLRQYRNLRGALECAFGSNAKVQFLQEPVASLVPFFDKASLNGAGSGYNVAAFDLGGGTTDITVVHVTHDTAANNILNIRPKILASWGERFGGEDLTDFIVQEIKDRCARILAAEHPLDQIADRNAPNASTSSTHRNEYALAVWAESFKVSLSEETNTDPPASSIVLNIVPPNLHQLPYDRPFYMDEIRGAGKDLDRVFLDYLSARIRKMGQRLQESLIGIAPLDYIHLSGKTAFLAEVGNVLRSMFPTAKIERASDPKECVVRGACMWRSLQRGQHRRLVLPSARRTTSQIGIVDEDDTFRPFIHLDQPIPEKGLIVEIPNQWNGQDNITLWENLGVETRRVLDDGTRNTLISKLDTWKPSRTGETGETWLPLRLTLEPDFTLHVASEASGQIIEFHPAR